MEDLGVNGKSIESDLKEVAFEDVAWIHLTQNRVKYRAVVSTVMNVHVP
jgi:hypothetical protein